MRAIAPVRSSVLLTICIAGSISFAMQPSASAQNPNATRNEINLSTSNFYFGPQFEGSPISSPVATLTNSGKNTVVLNPAIDGSTSFTIEAGGCQKTLAPGATCTLLVRYLPGSTGTVHEAAVLSLGIQSMPAGHPQSVRLHGESGALGPGRVRRTANSMVAQYTLTLPFAGSWSVNFGPTTSYGRKTSARDVDDRGTSSLYVAGMLPNTTYHMQASVTLAGGATAVNEDQTFTTGALPHGIPATVRTTTTPGTTPQPGVELINTLMGAIPGTALVADLQGNVIWAYQFPDRTPQVSMYPVRFLPNGNFLAMIAPIYPSLPAPGMLNVIREFDLAGNTVQEFSMTDLNARLAANGFSLTLSAFSHDLVVLPNGHYLVIANTFKQFTDLPGYPGTKNVAGDTVIDLDPSLQPRWVWNSFDHLDINRHPMQFPDWTHANSVAYSKDDGNFVISLRHQNWVLKIDYQDGKGTGNVVWHLGKDGDFALQGANDPTDWFYAQHDANFTSPNTTGVFSMTVFDNGDDRALPSGEICGPLPGQTHCFYSTAPELQVDENTKTARFLFHAILPANLYSGFAGDHRLLRNGNFEYNLAGSAPGAFVFEVKPGASVAESPQTVWSMALPGTFTYRAMRQPSLYPDVQW